MHRHDTHELLAAKNAETSRLGKALGVSSDYREGDAFDRELQAEKAAAEKAEREERQQRRQQEYEERKKIQVELEQGRQEHRRKRMEEARSQRGTLKIHFML